MRKLYMLFVLIIFVFILQACGGDSSESGTSNGNGEPATSEGTSDSDSSDDVIKIGLLTAYSGGGAHYGPPTENAALLAIKEINEAGGLLGRQLELIVGDTATDPSTASERAKSLIEKDNVDVIVSELTSAEREAVVPVINDNDILYFYNDLYEGKACAENMYINAEVPEQQIKPVIPYIIDEFDAPNWFIIGSDYVYGHESGNAIREAVEENGGTVLGEEYTPLGTTEYSAVLTKIEQLKPDFIGMAMIGDAVAFMKQFHERGLNEEITVLAFASDENMVDAMGESAIGMMEPTAYFLDHETPGNVEFLEKYYAEFGEDAPKQSFISIPTYDSVHSWALAVEAAGSIETEAVKEYISEVTFDGPRGEITYDASSHHANLPIYLGEVQENGKFEVIKEFGVVSPGNQCNF